MPIAGGTAAGKEDARELGGFEDWADVHAARRADGDRPFGEDVWLGWRARRAGGRLLYLVHLAVLLWWLLDRSSKQRATAALVALTAQLLPSAALMLRLPPIRRFVSASWVRTTSDRRGQKSSMR